MKKLLLLLAVAVPLLSMGQSFDKLKKQADAGSATAMVALHYYYAEGVQTPVDSAAAYALLQKATALGNDEAKGNLAVYELRYRRDTAAALRLTKELVDAGSPYGLWRHAIHLSEGIGGTRNYALAHRLLQQSADAGCQDAIASLANDYLNGHDSCDFAPDRALPYIKKLKEGVGSDKYSLMNDYFTRINDPKQARQWVLKGLKVGSYYSQVDNIVNHFYGFGVAEDEHAAMQLLAETRAKYGPRYPLLRLEAIMRMMSRDPLLHDTAQVRQRFEQIGDEKGADNYSRLGESYLYGQFTPQDSARAIECLQRGARNEDVHSLIALASLAFSAEDTAAARQYLDRALATGQNEANTAWSGAYSYGTFGTADYAAALPYAREAGRRGDMDQLVHAGKLHLWLGDTARGRECFQRAIDLRHYNAYANLAYLERDAGNSRWLDYLKKGAKLGNAVCLNALGDIYANEEDYKTAAKYYAQADDDEGRYELGRLYILGGIGSQSDADMLRGYQLVRSAEGHDYADAIFFVAGMFESGIFVDQSYDSVVPFLQRLVAMDDTRGMMHLARYYENGLSVETDSTVALGLYFRACSNGSGTACDILGDRYRYGQASLIADPQTAFVYYNQAASIEGDNAYGLYDVATCILQGIGTHVDTAKALVYLEQAAAAGSPAANSLLGDFYWYGWAGVKQDQDTALSLYHTASLSDDPRGDYMMGAYLYDEGRYENALGFLNSAAQHGSLPAYILLGQALLRGDGIEADPATAVQMIQNVIDADTTGDAAFVLGIATLAGRGIEADTLEGLHLIEQAVDMGNTRAMMQLGRHYAEGKYVEQDTVQCVELFERAVSAGNIAAMLQLGGSYMKGSVAPLNPKRGAELYQMAADRGNLDALCRLGLCYEEGTGVVLNSRRAYNLYMQAAERGSAWGMRLVAFCYAQGIYVEEDNDKAAQWMLRAAEAGDISAAYIVSQLYAAGEGLKKNKKEARRWLTVAAEGGHPQAIEALGSR